MASAKGGNNKSAAESYPMVGGDGPNSYSQNSVYQRDVIEVVKALLDQSIAEKLDVPDVASNSFCIADLGCSVGPNTFAAVQNIIDAVEKKLMMNSEPDFHVLFNDHTENDFNALFRSLPPRRRYFAAGVPGSFHGRLFPKSTLHFVHTSYSLQWLSAIPSGVADPKSAEWNGGDIYCSGRVGEVERAYAAQFGNDMDGFLSARAQEIVGGGLMAITIAAFEDEVLPCNTTMGFAFDLIASSLSRLANLGITSKEKVESFNLPIYFPRKDELVELVSKNGNFNIERVEIINLSVDYDKVEMPIASFVTAQFRAFLDDLIAKHFGSEIPDQLFQLFRDALEDMPFYEDSKNTSIFILLKRKI